MASAFYILDFKGSPLVYRSFRGDITQDVSAVFHRRVLDEDCCVVPVFEEQGYTYAFIRVNDVYLVMVSKIKISPLLQIAFMRRCVGVFESYFKRVTEKTVQDNFVIIYELIDEMCDFGFPQYTEVKILKEYITQTGFFDTLLSSDTLNAHDLPAAVTASGSATAWREPGRYLYARNEIFLDVIESINMLISPDGAVLSSEILGVLDMRTRLSGMPTVQVGLNDRILYYINSLRGPTVDMEDIKFHQCVRLNEFESDRVISFIPPDGRFELMTYRCNRKLNPPVAVTCRIRQHGNSRVDMRITVNTNYQSTVFANYVDVMVPIPNDADNPKARCTLGQVSYIPETSMLMWGLGALGNRKSGVCHAQYHLPSVRSTDARVVSTEPIQVRFKIPYFAVSGFAVRYVRVTEASNYHVQPWVRYITQNGDYHIRTN